MFYFQTLCKTSQFPTLQNQNQWKWIFNFLRIIPAWGHPVPPTPTVNFTVPWTFFYHFPILTAPKAWAEQSLLLICISVRHLDRAPAFACSSNRPISRHGRHAAFYPSYNTSDLGLYPGIQPFLGGYHQVRHTHQIFIKFDKGLRGPAHAICWWGHQKSCQQFTWQVTLVTKS